MKQVTLIVPDPIATQLSEYADLAVESAGVLLVSILHCSNGNIRLLARQMHWIDPDSYVHRTHEAMSIRPESYVGFLAEAANLGATPIWVHTHPGQNSSPRPSHHDNEVDRQIIETFRIRAGTEYYGTLILSPRPNGITFTGYLQGPAQETNPISRLWDVSDQLRLTSSADSKEPVIDSRFDRSVRAFGGPIQQMLAQLHLGIVGCGGTGSAVFEQLARLGVANFTLVDPDVLSKTNLTRVYGTGEQDVGQYKVDILKRHGRRISEAICVNAIPSMITVESTAAVLDGCDLVFGCTDDNAGRLVLSRFPTYLLTPVIDCGVLLSSDTCDHLTGIDGRVTTLLPGTGCLVCRNRIDLRRAAAELRTPAERRKLEDEGYAPALGSTEPAVVTFTTLVAATAVAELLERLVGYGPVPRPTETLVRIHEREISTNRSEPRIGHYCHPGSGKRGIGRTHPFLDQTWVS
ncbi:MAG: ThiF family adenylyltransferase [Gammaproteobacteria bacterium]|nr:ThiF family adenylyltransferase [Gammaproteobacteria bacterium]